MSKLTTTQMESLKEGIDNSFYWFNQDAVIELLSNLGPSDEKVMIAVAKLLEKRNNID